MLKQLHGFYFYFYFLPWNLLFWCTILYIYKICNYNFFVVVVQQVQTEDGNIIHVCQHIFLFLKYIKVVKLFAKHMKQSDQEKVSTTVTSSNKYSMIIRFLLRNENFVVFIDYSLVFLLEIVPLPLYSHSCIQLLKSKAVSCAVGTPARVHSLLDTEALHLKSPCVLALDVSWQDVKKRTLLELVCVKWCIQW